MALLFSVVLLFMLAMPAWAAEQAEIAVALSQEQVKPGDTVTVTISMPNYSSKALPEVTSIEVRVPVDAQYFTFVEGSIQSRLQVSDGAASPMYHFGPKSNSVIYIWTSVLTPLPKTNREICTFQLKVKPEAAGKRLTLQPEIGDFWDDIKDQEVPHKAAGATLTIAGTASGAETNQGQTGTGTAEKENTTTARQQQAADALEKLTPKEKKEQVKKIVTDALHGLGAERINDLNAAQQKELLDAVEKKLEAEKIPLAKWRESYGDADAAAVLGALYGVSEQTSGDPQESGASQPASEAQTAETSGAKAPWMIAGVAGAVAIIAAVILLVWYVRRASKRQIGARRERKRKFCWIRKGRGME